MSRVTQFSNAFLSIPRSLFSALPIMLTLTCIACTGVGPNLEQLQYSHDKHWPRDLHQFPWGIQGEFDPTLSGSAAGVGVDRDQALVYVLVRSKPHVRVFREDGRFVRSWSPANAGRMHMLHVDQQGKVWIADNQRHTVTQYTPEGKVLLVLGTASVSGMDGRHFNGPTDISTSQDGRFVFVADGYGNNRIAKFDRFGNYLAMWGGAEVGIKPGQFKLPHSITTLDDRVYVADRSGARIQVFDLEGNFLDEWRDVIIPWGIASFDGKIFVAGERISDGMATDDLARESSSGDYNPKPSRQDLLVFNTLGEVVKGSKLSQGRVFGQVDWVHGIDVGAKGDVYLADVVGNHIQRWRE